MRLSTLKVTMCILTAALLSPLGLLASSTDCSGTPSALSNTWDFHREATELLEDVHARAAQVLSYADTLEALDRDGPLAFWQDHAEQLSDIRDNVNKMGASLCRLQAIKSAASPWQQQAIDRIVPRAMDLATETDAAIKLLNDHQAEIYALSEYSTDVKGIFSSAEGVVNSVRQFPEYAQARKELEKPLKSATVSGM
jgi:hypothetical protein